MSFGIVEVITLLLGLAGFGVAPNPKAPTADQALVYAVPDADFVAHIDAASLIPGNYKLLGQLANQPQIKASPDLQKMVQKAVNEIEGARGLAKTATGIDLATDVSDATAFFQIVPHAPSSFVVAVHGRFSTANLDKIAKMSNKQVAKVGAGSIVETGDKEPAVGVTKDGVLLLGTPALVRERLGDGWKAPAHAAGTPLGYAADVINARPVFAFVLTMSQTGRTEFLRDLGSQQNVATDLIKRHKAASFSMFHDGIGWTWVDSTKGGVDSMEMMSQGILDILRAAQIAPRGVAKVILGALDSYKGTSKQVDDLIKHKADVLKIVDTYTGDGTFKVAINKDAANNKLEVRATGKSISEVVPFGFVLPGMAVGFLTFSRKVDAPPAVMAVPTPTPVPVPKTKKP